MNNALARCQRKLFGAYANIEIEVKAIVPSRSKPRRRRAKERRFSTAAYEQRLFPI